MRTVNEDKRRMEWEVVSTQWVGHCGQWDGTRESVVDSMDSGVHMGDSVLDTGAHEWTLGSVGTDNGGRGWTGAEG